MYRREAIQTYLNDLVHGGKKGFFASMLLSLLTLASILYSFGVRAQLACYAHGFMKRKRLPCKVISLGNITVGGTGKTPSAQVLAKTMRDMGYKVVILNRGYRAAWQGKVGVVSDGRKIYMTATEAGDEAYLLAKNLPGVPVLIGRKRYLTGLYARKRFDADVAILDDGYQHWQLERDLDIVLIDSMRIFGNQYILPRGTLREPLENLKRADAFLLTKVDQAADGTRDNLRKTLQRYNPQAMIVESVHQPCNFIEIEDWYKGTVRKNVPLNIVKGKRVVALSAIGNPASFEHTIASIGVQAVDAVRYPDHHSYTMAEMQCVMQKALDKAAFAIVTTEKDAVKIPSEFIYSNRSLPIYVLGIEVKITAGETKLFRLMRDTLITEKSAGEKTEEP